jgi:patatin-related protein
MEPLRDLWLENADIETLLDPEARPASAVTKLWAMPLVWAAGRRRDETVDTLVEPAAREEVRAKVSHFIRSRWFEPPFGGEVFTNLLLDAFLAMEEGKRGPRLIPDGQPLDLFVTVTDLAGHPEQLALHSPPRVTETEHRLVISFSGYGGQPQPLGDMMDLLFAARATSSFPGAFPPFQVSELDRVLADKKLDWPGRAAFLKRIFPRRQAAGLSAEDAILIDGSVLANAPFRPAIGALRHRPAHREVDRRFVYIDPKPGRRSVSLGTRGDQPGFFTTILKALSDLPREQPIRDNLEAIEGMSRRIREMRRIVAGMRPDVDAAIEAELGGTFFLDRPTPQRLANWRAKVQAAAAREAGFAYSAYGHQKLSGILDELAVALLMVAGQDVRPNLERVRTALWHWARDGKLDRIADSRAGATAEAIAFFRQYDVGFRIRRLRLLARRLVEMADAADADLPAIDAAREAVYESLAPFLDLRRIDALAGRIPDITLDTVEGIHDAVAALGEIFDLRQLDANADERLCQAFHAFQDKGERRQLLHAYLGFPFYDIATLPLLQGEGLDEFDPVKVDRIAPDDATTIREGGAEATLKGIQFNSFGAFFSRAYRENDYLWGRLHGAERMIDILVSALPQKAMFAPDKILAFKRRAFRSILEAERPYLHNIGELLDSLEEEIG